MTTPIFDFIKKYTEKTPLRLHMPGHKGMGETEKLDLTEINGADSLFEADGIIKESEENASSLFGSHTFYSTEGSSLCIRAMMFLCCLYAKEKRGSFKVLAARNVHKSFVSASAAVGFETKWLKGETQASYLSFVSDLKEIEEEFITDTPTVLYLTSPDYLGSCIELKSIAELCHRYGVLLAVDNAHGAYLKFLPEPSRHPIDLGADICCDSAHKTLPVLTGGAYLHISKNAPQIFVENAKRALSLFASTSPSYLILRSLDLCNAYLENGYKERISEFIMKVDALKKKLKLKGFTLYGNEPMKITVMTKPYGYTGNEFGEILISKNVYPEFTDPDFVTLMLTCELGEGALDLLYTCLASIPQRQPILVFPPKPDNLKKKMSVREAVFSLSEKIDVSDSIGRILSDTSVGCPPAVPIVISGEVITESAVKCFEYYGIKKISVVKE